MGAPAKIVNVLASKYLTFFAYDMRTWIPSGMRLSWVTRRRLTIKAKIFALIAIALATNLIIGAAYLWGRQISAVALSNLQGAQSASDHLSEIKLAVSHVRAAEQRFLIEMTGTAAHAVAPPRRARKPVE